MGPFYNRSLRRPNNEIVAKVRVLASGSGWYPHGCVFHSMDKTNESIWKSSLESHLLDIAENQARTTPVHSSGGLLLTQHDLVPSVNPNGLIQSIALSSLSGSKDISQNDSPSTLSDLDALRLAIIRNKLVKANLNEQAIQDLLTQKLASNPTNRAYRKNQLRFLEWANHNHVSYTAFSGADLVNFLATTRQTHNFQIATLKMVRAAVSHLRDNHPGISEDSLSYLPH